jgi:uncharacterized protein YndB with AHSA1/START domain
MTVQDSAVHLTRVIPGAPERVFAAWTDARTFARWFAPHGYDVSEIEIDPRVGGRYRVTVTGPDGDRHTTSGVYTEISPPHRLAMSWTYRGDHPDAQHEETHLVVECLPHAEGTELRLLHTRLRTDRARANVAGGWQGCLDKLESLFAGDGAHW